MDFKPYVLKTTDFGRTWTSVASNLPSRSPVYVVKEDLKNPSLLFVGNEVGAFASVDAGATWRRLETACRRCPCTTSSSIRGKAI